MTTPIWQPSEQRIAEANMTRFLGAAGHPLAPGITDYPSLYRWSVEQPQAFWSALWSFCDVRCSTPWEQVVVDFDRMPGARWFVGSRLNLAENLLRYRDDRPALIFRGEGGQRARLSYAELYAEVARLAGALRGAGVSAGDRVAGFMPNLPETVVAMLACTSLGAIWSSCSPDFGVQGIMDRFGQIAPKVLFCADGCRYNGKTIDCLRRARSVAEQLPGLEKVVVVPCLEPHPHFAAIPEGVHYQDFLSDESRLDFEQLPFDHPVYILYSSGTTGVPKCIVHGAGGTLLQHLKELTLHTDLKREDRIFYFTTCGWMMWNWLVSSLAVGATVLLYDGSPTYPKDDVLFDLAEQEGMTVFGTSARYLSAIEKAGVRPRATHDLGALKAMLSTGSPLLPEGFDFVYRDIKQDLQLASISGGTDIISCFALGNPIVPVYRGELQTRGLGMRVEVFDAQGRPRRGEKGELVCTAPFPSMPVGFWNDPDGRKYRVAYFDYFPGVWRHGDYAELTEHDGMIIYGRSDATLNPGGVRIGTAEIYRQVEKFPEVLESLVIAQEWQGDQRIVLFVRLRPDLALDQALVDRIKAAVRDGTTPRHVPAKVVQVADIPRTISGKIVELAVRNLVHGRPVANIEALANPEALELFRDIPDLK